MKELLTCDRNGFLEFYARSLRDERQLELPVLIESFRRLRVPVRQYLAGILPGLADMPIQDDVRLKPTAWAAKTHT